MPPHRHKSKRPVARILFWLFCLLGIAVRAAEGQLVPPTAFELTDAALREIDSTQASELASIREMLEEAQWEEAIDRLIRLAETGDAELVHLSGNRYVTLRQYCQYQIGQLPPAALELYRLRVDSLAETWFTQGVADRDPIRLRRIMDTMFCSSWGDDALDALGELALEQGHYATARAYWERISRQLRGPEGRPMWLALRAIDLDTHWDRVQPILAGQESVAEDPWFVYPDTDLSIVDVRARLILVSIRERSFDRAAIELALFSKLHPEAEGSLGGRRVRLANALRDLLADARNWPVPSPSMGWPTFAGSFERTGRAPRAVPIASLAWEASLTQTANLQHTESVPRLGFSGRRIGEDVERPLSFHAVLVGDQVFYCDAHRVYARDLATGKGAYTPDGVIYSPQREPRPPEPAGRQWIGFPRYTLTAHAGRLYACMSDPAAGRTEWQRERLIGLDLTRGGMLLFEETTEDASWSFEGAPVADDRYIYVAMRQRDVSPRASVACFDGHTGKMRWRTFIASGSTPGQPGWDEISNNLLTLVEGTIYYNTNLGVVGALSADDGTIQWVARYDRAQRGDLSRRAAHFYRDLTPCVYDDGLLFVAPADSPYIFALDALSGQVMWATDLADDVVHLLGVADGNLIASGDRLWWLNAQTGKVAAPPWPESRKAGVRGQGRGFLAGDRIYWPTQQAEILIFRTVPKRKPDEVVQPVGRIDLAAYGTESGNILVTNDFLLVVTSDRMVAFNQFPRERARLEREAAARPDDPAAQLRFAQCERAMEDWDRAVRYYRRTIELSRNRQTLRAQASQELTAMLLERAELLHDRGQVDRAIAQADEALRLAVMPGDRVKSLLFVAEIEAFAERPVAAIARWQRILSDNVLAGYPVVIDEHRKLAARLVARDRIDQAIRDYGRGVYVRQEAAATEAMANARYNGQHELHAIARQYPNARITQDWEKSIEERSAPTNHGPHPTAVGPMLGFRLTDSFDVPGRTLLANHGEEVLVTRDTLLTADGKTVHGIALQDGSNRWHRLLDGPIIDAVHDGRFATLATARTLARLEMDRGQLAWRIHVAGTGRADAAGSIAQIGLGTDGWISVLLDNGVLQYYHAQTGRFAWQYQDPLWRVTRLPFVFGRNLLLQRAPRSWEPDHERPYQTVAMDSGTGQITRILPVGSAAWARQPLRIGDSQVILVDLAGKVQMVDMAWNEFVWSRRATRLPASQAEVYLAGDVLLLLDGVGDMLRIDPADGRALWQDPVSVGPQILARPRRVIAWDNNAVYFVSAGKLKAFALTDGRLRWPASDVRIAPEERRWRWQVHRFGSNIVTHPLEFAEPDGFRFVVVQESNGRVLAQSDPILAPPGEARVVWRPGHAILVGHARIWKLE